jgi:hypothetical protein
VVLKPWTSASPLAPCGPISGLHSSAVAVIKWKHYKHVASLHIDSLQEQKRRVNLAQHFEVHHLLQAYD